MFNNYLYELKGAFKNTALMKCYEFFYLLAILIIRYINYFYYN